MTNSNIKNSFIISILMVFHFIGSAQNSKQTFYGMSFDQYSTANGHGGFYSPALTINRDRHTVSFSPLIQKRSMLANGFKLGYSCNVTGESSELFGGNSYEFFQINVFSYVQYNSDLPLSYRMVTSSRSVQTEPKIDLNQVKFSTGEASAGFQLQLNITPRLSWKSYVGASVYHHFNYTALMNHDKTGVSLCIGTGIHILMSNL